MAIRVCLNLVLWAAPFVALRAQTTIVYRLATGDMPAAVEPRPRLDLGEGGALELFSRIVTIRVQGSGNVVVANRNPPELRVFDSNGRHVRTIGRKGQGPGEFQDIDDVVGRRGDSLAVLDNSARRFTFFGPGGEIDHTVGYQAPFPTPPFNVTINPLDDGTLLIGYGLVTTLKPTPVPVGVPVVLGRYDVSGSRLDSIGMFFTREHFLQAAPPNRGGFAFWDRTFGRTGTIVSTGSSFFHGDATRMEVRKYSANGVLLETHRIDVPPKPLTGDAIARYKQGVMSNVRAEREVAQRRVDEMPYPSHLPAYRRFVIDARGRIWLHEYLHPAVDNQWIVMDPSTRIAKTVRLPDRFVPYHIGATDIAGVWRDTDDVEHVRVYRLTQ